MEFNREQHDRQRPTPPFPEQKIEKPGIESELKPRPQYQAPEYRAAGKLEGKRALITGGDSGIGRAVAVLYAREGADVAITCLPDELSDAEETRRAVERAGRKCVILVGDLTDVDFCEQVIEQTVRELGGLDILVSNAAHQNHRESLEELIYEDWDRTFRTNIYAYYVLVRYALPHLRPGSSIIATSSVTAFAGSKGLLDYSATKGAINSFTKSLARALIDRGIRVNAVAPGPVWTPLNPADEGTSPQKVSHFGEDYPMHRPAQPDEIAPAFVFLASEADSSYISGVILLETGAEIVQ